MKTIRKFKLYLDDFEDKKLWIEVCKCCGILLNDNLINKKTGYEIQELTFDINNIEGC